MIRFAAVFVLVILGILFSWLSGGDRLKPVSAAFSGFFLADRPALGQERFRSEALRELNQLRRESNVPELSVDPELERALDLIARSQPDPSQINLDTLFSLLRDRFPGSQFLSATLVLDPEEAGLLADLRAWDEVRKEDYQSVATLVFEDGSRLGCLTVLTRRLPSFDLEMANREGGRYFNRCPRCDNSHTIELDRYSTTLILTCPGCSRPYDVLATDVKGRFRRAPAFLEGGFRPPADAFPVSENSERRLREIWGGVLARCEYEYDTKGPRRGEAWKTPAQTWRDRAGDCEDTAILLTDLLIDAGIDARVAVGWNIHVGQHAWAVARIGRGQYLLETTIRREPDEQFPDLLPVAEAATEYRPEQLFDRERLYFREGLTAEANPQPCLDYWTEREWPAVSYPVAAAE